VNPICTAGDRWATDGIPPRRRFVRYRGELGMAVTELAVALGVSTLAALLIYWMVGRPTS